MSINIYRKLTGTDTTIHYLSNHPFEQKMVAFRYHINRLITLPITQERKETEWATIQKTKKQCFPNKYDREAKRKTSTPKAKTNKPQMDTIYIL